MLRNCIYFASLLFIFSIIFPATAIATETKVEYTSEQFLNIARRAHPEKTWAVLIGSVSNKRRGVPITHKADIKVGMRFTNSRIMAKVSIKEINENLVESYTVGQPYNGQPASILASEDNENDISLLGEFGLRPEDLTMTFLYWNLEKEYNKESVKGFNCRVLELINPKTEESVKVYISTKYFAPIKVEWFKPNQKKSSPYRNVIISSFETKGNLGAPSILNIYGPGWRTKVDFSNIRMGYAKDGIPKDIFTNNFLTKN